MERKEYYINERIIELENKLKESMNEKDLLDLLHELSKPGGWKHCTVGADRNHMEKPINKEENLSKLKEWVKLGIEEFPDCIPLLVAMGDMMLEDDWKSAESYYLKSKERWKHQDEKVKNLYPIIPGIHPEDKNEVSKRLSIPDWDYSNSIYFRLGYLYLIRENYKEALAYFDSIPESFRNSDVNFLQILLSAKIGEYSKCNELLALFMKRENQEAFSSIKIPENEKIEILVNSSLSEWKNLLNEIELSKNWIDFLFILVERMNLGEDLRGLFIEKILQFHKENNTHTDFISFHSFLLFHLYEIYKKENNFEATLNIAMNFPDSKNTYNSVEIFIRENGNMKYFYPFFLTFFEKNEQNILSKLENFYYLAYDKSGWDVFLSVINAAIQSNQDKHVLADLHFYLGKYHLKVSGDFKLAYDHLKKSIRKYPTYLAYWGIGEYYFMKERFNFAISFFNKSLEMILEQNITLRSIHELYPEENLSTLIVKKLIARIKMDRFQENIVKVSLKEMNSPEVWEFLSHLHIPMKYKILLGWKLGLYFLKISELENANEYFEVAKKNLLRLTEDGLSQEDLDSLNEFIFPYRSNNAKDLLSQNLQGQLDEISNRLKRERERELEIKNNHLAFLSHTLRHSLAGASGTLKSVISMGIEIQKEGEIQNPMFFNAIQDLNKLHLTHKSMESLLDLFRLFTKDRDRFKEEWEREESGTITPNHLIALIMKQVLHRILFHDEYSKVTKRMNSQSNKKSMQKIFLTKIFQKDLGKDNAPKLLEEIQKIFPNITIEIEDSLSNWEEFSIKYNVLISLISEIVLNAIKYSDYREPIHIEWKRNRDFVHLSVKNTFNKDTVKSTNSQTGLKFMVDLIRDLKNCKLKITPNREEYQSMEPGIYCVDLEIGVSTGDVL